MKLPDFAYPSLAFLIWGGWGVVISALGVAGVTLNFFASAFGFLFILLYAIYKGAGRILIALPLLPTILLMAVLEAINTATFYTSFTFTTIANAVFTHLTAPIFVALLAPMLLKEKIARSTYIAIMLSLAGLALMLSNSGFSFTSSDSAGIALGTISGIAYGASTVVRKQILGKGVPADVMALCQLLIISLLMVPLVAAFGTFSLSQSQFWGLLLVGLVMIAGALLLYYRGLSRMQAQKVALLGYLEPLSAVLLGLILLSQAPPLTTVAGGALILGANYLALRRN